MHEYVQWERYRPRITLLRFSRDLRPKRKEGRSMWKRSMPKREKKTNERRGVGRNKPNVRCLWVFNWQKWILMPVRALYILTTTNETRNVRFVDEKGWPIECRLDVARVTGAQHSDETINPEHRGYTYTLVVACRRRLSLVCRRDSPQGYQSVGIMYDDIRKARFTRVAMQRLGLGIVRRRFGVTVYVWRASKRIECSSEFILSIPRKRDVSIQIFRRKPRHDLRTAVDRWCAQTPICILMCLTYTAVRTVSSTFSAIPSW